jgi:Xaa-Pro dipeptidase
MADGRAELRADLMLASRRIGVEYTAMRVLELRAIEAVASGAQVLDATAMIAELRMVKDDQELAAMRRAVAVVAAALGAAVAQIRAGMTELELAAVWEREMRARGGEPSFGTIIASGPNAANPHHSNSERVPAGRFYHYDGGSGMTATHRISRAHRAGPAPEQAHDLRACRRPTRPAGVCAPRGDRRRDRPGRAR